MKIFPFLALALGVGAISSTKASTALQAYQASFVLSSYAKTKYPIVFAHGFGSLLGHSMNVLTQNQYPVEITAALDAMHPEKYNALMRYMVRVLFRKIATAKGLKSHRMGFIITHGWAIAKSPMQSMSLNPPSLPWVVVS